MQRSNSWSPLQVRPVGYDGNNPTSVAEWLESLELGDYTKSFLINGYTSMELVKKIWEIELINVSFISAHDIQLMSTSHHSNSQVLSYGSSFTPLQYRK